MTATSCWVRYSTAPVAKTKPYSRVMMGEAIATGEGEGACVCGPLLCTCTSELVAVACGYDDILYVPGTPRLVYTTSGLDASFHHASEPATP